MKKDFQGGSRYNYRSKRKKTNLILNGLIVIVLILIAFVAYNIFLSGNDKTAAKKEVQTTVEKTQTEQKSVHKNKKDSSPSAGISSAGSKSQTDKKGQTTQEATSSSSKDNSNSDTLQTVNSPDATASTPANGGQHVTSYDSNSQDWQEMLQAMSGASGVDQGNMTVWFLGSDKGTPNGSVGTISAKDNKQQKFRVYLQWTDGQGWKATKVETITQ